MVPEATPAVKVSEVLAAPKFWSAASRSRKVGAVAGLVELEAPVNVSVWLPPYAVSVLPYASVAVTVAVCDVPAVWAALPVTTKRVAAAAVTPTVRRSLPVEAAMVPSVTAMLAVSTLYSFIEPTPPAVLETPAVNVFVVTEPKFVAVGVLLVTVGAVTGLVELLAPEKVRFFEPV